MIINNLMISNHLIKFPEGFFSVPDILCYRKLVNQLPNNSILVEIGTWYGRSLCSLFDIILCKNLEVYAVDNFKGSEYENTLTSKLAKKNNVKQILVSNIEKYGLDNNIKVIESISYDSSFFDKKANMVFIDADHTYESLSKDICAWLPKIVHGGTISGHDYSNSFLGVKRCVEEKFYEFKTDGIIWYATV